MALGTVDGEHAVIIMCADASGLTPFSAIRIQVLDGHIVSIADYVKSSWILGAAAEVLVT